MNASRTSAISAARRLGSEFRYQPLAGLLNREVLIREPLAAGIATADEVRRLLGHEVIFDGPDLERHKVAVAKYGLFDLTFTVPGLRVDSVRIGGFSALRELGFGNDAHDPPVEASEGASSTFLDMMIEDVERELVYVRIMLRDPDFRISADRLRWSREGFPPGFWPRAFAIDDACLTNAPALWMSKHFYL